MIVLDLEFNSGLYEPENLDEILQIGAVRVDRPGGAVREVFNAYIKPRVHKRLSPGARVLPELAESLERGTGFEEVYRSWLRFIDGETEFAEWGRDDFKILCRNALHYGLEPVFPEKYTDIQSAFSKALGGVNTAQLYQAAEYCRIPDTFVFHNALHDALYTSLIGGFLPEEALTECTFPLTREDVLAQPHPLRKRKGTVRMGPFLTRELALNNMGCRRAVCPECRRAEHVASWHTRDGATYLGSVNCPDHGTVIRRLKLIADDTGKFWTYNDVLPATDKNLRTLAKATAGETFTCSRRKGAHARRRGRHGKGHGKNT